MIYTETVLLCDICKGTIEKYNLDRIGVAYYNHTDNYHSFRNGLTICRGCLGTILEANRLKIAAVDFGIFMWAAEQNGVQFLE